MYANALNTHRKEPDMTAVPAPYTLQRREGGAARSPALASRMPPPSERRAGLLRFDVARIIAERHFSLAFQPVVRLTDRRAAYHEALLRLRPPDGLATLPTRVFVEVASGWGLSRALDEAVLDAALTAWNLASSTPVSVNLAATSLCDAGFIGAALTRIAGEGAALLVEVPASADIGARPALGAGIAALQEAGVRVCLDDLGADPAALDCVQVARFDQVKLAGASVRAAASNERGRRLVSALLSLAAATHAETVAKHIETLPQAWLMQELGVRYGQGWLFGAPGPLPDTYE
jgi:EAL domain-containing protein (putative c-di-GMP-specific phosphodiesterase class I)